MEALRKVDRYGVTRSGEQYKGWTPLPASGGLQSDEEAAQMLCRFADNYLAGDLLNSPAVAKAAYREAARATHPDRNGQAEDFHAVQTAWERIRMRHRI